jgi:O-antigen ligase
MALTETPNRYSAKDVLAASLLALGAVAVVIVVLEWKVFELDRYFVPKELVLHATAFAIAAALAIRGIRGWGDNADWLLAFFLAWSAVSAVFAGNQWLAQRALAVSISSAAIFWCARSLSEQGLMRLLLAGAAAAGVAAAITSLLQAYGVESPYFTLARAPGGTLGNRNFVAHLAAIALPSAAWCAVTTRSSAGSIAGYIGTGMLAATLVLSRSRAAWLAVAAYLVIILIPLFVSRKHWGSKVIGSRLGLLLLALALGGLLAVVLPNTLNWKSDSPYLDSARNVVDYSKGSGRGRIAQYRNSLEMVKKDPLLGVGPGNWPVKYVRVAPRNDKSLAESGMTANPWPSSDWVAYVSERGLVAALALLGVFASLFFGSLRKWRDLPDGSAVLAKVALAATIVATMVVSAFDAVLMLPAPAFVTWLAIGAAAGRRTSTRPATIAPRLRKGLIAVVLLLMSVSVARSGAMVMSMAAVGTGGTRAGWIRGALLDPGSYRINQRVAELYANRGQCSRARPFASRARSLFPDAAAPKRVLRRCGRS